MATDSEWLRARREGLTGSDAAAILDVSPYMTRWRVAAEKRGIQVEDPDEIERRSVIRWGNVIEWPAIQEYARVTGRGIAGSLDAWRPLVPGADLELLSHGEGEPRIFATSLERPWMRCTPDFLIPCWSPLPGAIDQVERDGAGLGELKTCHARQAHRWADGPPLHVRAQAQWNMATLGLSWAAVPVLIGGHRWLEPLEWLAREYGMEALLAALDGHPLWEEIELRWYDEPAHPRFQAHLIAEADRFRERYIIGDAMPPFETIEDARAVAKAYPRDNGRQELLPASLADVDREREEALAAIAAAEKRLSVAEGRIVEAIGESRGGVIDGTAVRYWLKTRKSGGRILRREKV